MNGTARTTSQEGISLCDPHPLRPSSSFNGSERNGQREFSRASSMSLQRSMSLHRSNSTTAQVAADLMILRERSGTSIVSVRPPVRSADSNRPWQSQKKLLAKDERGTYGALDDAETGRNEGKERIEEVGERRSTSWYKRAAGQVPAVALVGLFHLMIGIPFGVSYFPVGWRPSTEATEISGVGTADANGTFPLPGKEALGIRMFLFSTIIGQVVFTFASKFNNAIGLQMVENVPFCHSLANIAIAEQGYGMETLSTLFFLFGFASVVVGAVFYLLGRLKLGRVVYFFPSHVLIGCIGGIGVFIAITGLEVTTDTTFSFDVEGVKKFVDNINLLSVVFFFEILLRIIAFVTQHNGKPRYPLLSPIYFCMITPAFYLALWIFGIDIQDAENAGFFFPRLDECDPEVSDCGDQSALGSIFNEDLWYIWRILDFRTISWTAVLNSVPTLVALAAFSLIHVPINIPAFAISTNFEADMNAELIAHGYSNAIAGFFGGLQNYMAYTQSVIYSKSGGVGKASSLAVALVTTILFVVGPTIASYIPRCMAGTLLLHVGIDLFLEGVYDSYGKFDNLEYAGIWLIAIVMTTYGMSAALIAGIITALSTYAVQSITYLNPIRGSMSAATLRSSSWNRPPGADAILNDDNIGRNKIFVIQLQSHLFFGNIAHLTDSIKRLLAEKQGTSEEPWIVILDFSLVLGLDSSAAQAIAKLKNTMRKKFNVDLSIFVTGSSEGFPCEYDLSCELSAPDGGDHSEASEGADDCGHDDSTVLMQVPRRTMIDDNESYSLAPSKVVPKFPENYVCESLDAALIFSEDVLVAREDPTLLDDDLDVYTSGEKSTDGEDCSMSEERKVALRYLTYLCPGQQTDEVEELFSLFEREVYEENQMVWTQGSLSDSAKLLVRGSVLSVLENEAGTTEQVRPGNMIGELGLVHRTDRMSTVRCVSRQAVLYSLSSESFEILTTAKPRIARIVDMIVIRYLAHRVQHVSNRIFETRCVPI